MVGTATRPPYAASTRPTNASASPPSPATRPLGYAIPAEFEKLRLAAENALTRLRAASKQAPAELDPLKESHVGAREELAAFRARHRLQRPARERSHRLITIGILCVLVA